MKREIQNEHLARQKVESLFDVISAGICEAWWPKKSDFEAIWPKLNKQQKLVVNSSIRTDSIGKLQDLTGLQTWVLIKILREDRLVTKAIVIAKMCKLPSDTARSIYLETLIKNNYSRKFHYDEVQRIIKTDRDHLRELSAKLDISGDGKRRVLKDIVAYGMQLKQVSEEVVDEETGVVIAPAVLALADPRMALNSIQELNRMDHEYGQDDKATSSIEGQADRIRRLQAQMNTAAANDAKKLGGIARKVAKREIDYIERTENN